MLGDAEVRRRKASGSGTRPRMGKHASSHVTASSCLLGLLCLWLLLLLLLLLLMFLSLLFVCCLSGAVLFVVGLRWARCVVSCLQ